MNQARRTLASIGIAALVFTACGGSDDASGPQKELSDTTLELINDFADDEGITVDEDCVRDIINELSDDEATEGLAVLDDSDSDSDAFDATGEKIEDECFS